MSDVSSRISDMEDVVIKLWANAKGEQAKDPIKDEYRENLVHIFLPEEITLQPKEALLVDLRQEFIFPPRTSGKLSLGLYAATSGVCKNTIFLKKLCISITFTFRLF